MTKTYIENELKEAEKELAELDKKRYSLQEKINLLKKKSRLLHGNSTNPKVISKFTIAEKISIFKSLFRGREDVYPRRFESKKTGKSGYQPACRNEWKYDICKKPKVKCFDCHNRSLLPVNDAEVKNHLVGKDELGRDFTMGVYPLLEDDKCWFLAVDFDKKSWQIDIKAFIQTCNKLNIPVSIERSRSGNGGHAWIFFSEPVQSKLARQMGSYIITMTMDDRPELGFSSYDRLFPNQDTLPKGGFGNLIALPLQFKPRQIENSIFVDKNFRPFSDQWSYLASIRRMSPSEVYKISEKAVQDGRVIGVKMVADDETCPWNQSPSGIKDPIIYNLPKILDIVIGNQIYLLKEQLTPQLKAKLIRLAAFQNLEFYKAQAMRLPVYNKPRIISCYEDFPLYIGIPRGCIDEMLELLKQLNINVNLIDKRNTEIQQNFKFIGTLRVEQENAATVLLSYDDGVLSASTAFGKTVIAAFMIAKRNVNTLILVHRVQLIEQWRARLQNFLNINPKDIGVIGEGKRNPKSIIDIATIQSLCKKSIVDNIVGDYGFVIVDECHHLSAVSFELVAKQCKAKYFLGLSATLTRKDGHHPIIFMQCGPVRYKVSDIQQASERPFQHRTLIRKTATQLPEHLAKQENTRQIHDIYLLLQIKTAIV